MSPTIAAGTSRVSHAAELAAPDRLGRGGHPDRADRRVVRVARDQVGESLLDEQQTALLRAAADRARRRRRPSPGRARPDRTSGTSRSGCACTSAFRSGWASTGVIPDARSEKSASAMPERPAVVGRLDEQVAGIAAETEPAQLVHGKPAEPLDRDLAPGPDVERDPRPARSSARSSATRYSITSGSVGQSSRTCGVPAIVVIPSATAARAISRLSSSDRAPSSMPAEDVGVQVDHGATIRMWPCAR